MPFLFHKAEKPRRRPLTAEEQALAQVLYNAINRATDTIKLAELERILRRLDPDALNLLLNQITIARNQSNISNQIIEAIDIGGNEAIRAIKRLAPKLSMPAFKPAEVQITNQSAMANMDFTKIPAWAMPNPPKVKFELSFNKTNPNSLYFAQKRAGELVKSIDELTRIAVRKIITDAFNEQLDYRATARRIKNVVGLHPRWADAVTKFERAELARLIRTGMNEQKALRTAQERASRYSEQLKSKRATMIARTEIQIAQNEGRYEGWKQADQAGLVDPQSQKVWMTAEDERTCPICASIDGETIPWNGTFSIGVEAPIAHPQCRCTMVILPPER